MLIFKGNYKWINWENGNVSHRTYVQLYIIKKTHITVFYKTVVSSLCPSFKSLELGNTGLLPGGVYVIFLDFCDSQMQDDSFTSSHHIHLLDIGEGIRTKEMWDVPAESATTLRRAFHNFCCYITLARTMWRGSHVLGQKCWGRRGFRLVFKRSMLPPSTK